MKKSQVNFYSTCLALSHFYQKYEERIKQDAVLLRLFNEYFGYFEQLQKAVQIQKGHTSESAKMKQKEEAEMVEETVRYAYKGYVYASEKKLPGLLETFSVTSWGLQKLNDVKLHTACLSVHEALCQIDPQAVAEYGITTESLASLKKKIGDFHALISQPRTDIITRSQATFNIGEMTKQLKELFKNRLDKMVNSLPATDATMKNEYNAARIVIDISGKKPGGSTPPEDGTTQ